jgi:hypothetical protein
VQALESIATETGATVLAAHHTNKPSRGNGPPLTSASGRGSTAFFDGVRWQAGLSFERVEAPDAQAKELVTLSILKSNYSRKGDPVTLRRDDEHGGALIALSTSERETFAKARQAADPSAQKRAAKDAEIEAKNARVDTAVVEVVSKHPGISARALRAAVQRAACVGAQAAADGISRAVTAGELLREGTQQRGRCRMHGGLSTGATTPEGRERLREAGRRGAAERWRRWRSAGTIR